MPLWALVHQQGNHWAILPLFHWRSFMRFLLAIYRFDIIVLDIINPYATLMRDSFAFWLVICNIYLTSDMWPVTIMCIINEYVYRSRVNKVQSGIRYEYISKYLNIFGYRAFFSTIHFVLFIHSWQKKVVTPRDDVSFLWLFLFHQSARSKDRLFGVT